MESEKDEIIVSVDAEIRSLIPNFLANRQKDLKLLLDFLDKKDFESIRTLSHKIKGTSANFGFDEIVKMGVSLESAATQGNVEEMAQILKRLSSHLGKVKVVYE